MDVCPVGAITTRDYRFKSRPWDNPSAVDTICTGCAKGCNTTAWIKAKPEWAKGAQLVRMTPRFNAEINSYWMCDIGRFDYHWIESDRRQLQPHVRTGQGSGATSWAEALIAVKTAVDTAGGAAHARVLASGHASLEELYILKQFAPLSGGVTIGWRFREKPQPAKTTFRIPAVDAPNLRGARDLGFETAPRIEVRMQILRIRRQVKQPRQHLPLLRRPRDLGNRVDLVRRVVLSFQFPKLDDRPIMLRHLDHPAFGVIDGDRITRRPEIQTVHRLVVLPHILVALRRPGVIVERNARRNDIDESSALMSNGRLDQRRELLFVPGKTPCHERGAHQ
jgi:hypothetical protein